MPGAAVRCRCFAQTKTLVHAGACSGGHHTLKRHLRRQVPAMAALVAPRVVYSAPCQSISSPLGWQTLCGHMEPLAKPEASTCALQARPARSTSLQPSRVTSLLQKVCCSALATLFKACHLLETPAYLPGGSLCWGSCVWVVFVSLQQDYPAQGTHPLLCRLSPVLHQPVSDSNLLGPAPWRCSLPAAA